MPRVLFGPAPMRSIPHAWEPVLREAGHEIVLPPFARQMKADEVRSLLPGCAASLAGSEPYTREIIAEAAAAGLKVIARAGVGYDSIDVPAATEHGVVVAYAPGSNHEAVGEHAVMMMLALCKNLIGQEAETRAGQWPRRAYQPLREKTIGLIGLGRTGRATAIRAHAFRVNLMACDPYADPAFATPMGIPLLLLEDVLKHSDIVSLHVPLSFETRHLIRAETIALMKPGAMLINTSRGEIVHEADAIAALVSGRLGGAALDVFEREPLKDDPLMQAPNLILTAHTAGVDTLSQELMVNIPARAIVKLLAGDWPGELIVNPEVRDRLTL